MPERFSATAVTALITGVAASIGFLYVYKSAAKEKRTAEKLKRIMLIIDNEAGCKYKERNVLLYKLRTILIDGKQYLQILADFDKTLTRYYFDADLKAHSSFQVIGESSFVGSDIREKLSSLHSKYYPIEMSPDISPEEKRPLMVEWFTQAFNLGVNAGVKRSILPDMVKDSRVVLRLGMNDFLQTVDEYGIPLHVVSAGLGDIIEEVFNQQAVLPTKIHVLANYFEYNEDGISIGLKNEQLYHTFNKDEVYLLNKSYFERHAIRRNAIVMGDTLGDPNMTNNMDFLQCILKLGFLNSDVENSLSQYLSAYDLVLTGDASMAIVTSLIQELLSN